LENNSRKPLKRNKLIENQHGIQTNEQFDDCGPSVCT